MKLAGLGKFYTMLYDDRVDIYRTAKDTNDDQSTDIFYEQEPLYRDVPCRLSFSSDDRGADSAVDMNPVQFNPKLFCGPDQDLKAGDYLVIRRYSDQGRLCATYQGMVSMPSWYTTHQEAFVRIDEGA